MLSYPVLGMFRHDCPIAVKPASKAWRLLLKQTWRDPLHIDMLLSDVSVLVVALPNSEVLEGFVTYTVHTAELLAPDPSPFEVEIPTAKLKRYKSPARHQILAELIQAKGETLRSEIHRVINSIWNKQELPHQWKESTVLSIHKVIKM
jgi:hypothetical protein